MIFTKINTPAHRLPRILLERLTTMYPGGGFHSITHGFSVRRPVTIRANPLKISGTELKKHFQQKKIKFSPVSWYNDALILTNTTYGELMKLPEYQDGTIYAQSLSSMVPALVLKPQPGESVLDLCAAPGSKTTQMAGMMQNDGGIVANEIRMIRREKLNATIRIQKVKNTTVISRDGIRIGEEYPENFDAVLVDAPCSGEGRINIYTHGSYKGWSIKLIRDHAVLQKKLLLSAIFATKPGGRLVYSTCTLAPEENELVIDYAVRAMEGRVMIESMEVPGLVVSPPIRAWNGLTLAPDIGKTFRILPSSTMEGFFVARLRKMR